MAFTNATPLQLTFSRTGSNVTYSAGPVGGARRPPTPSPPARAHCRRDDGLRHWRGSTPTISFNNVAATITNLVIKDATGATVYDSATGSLVNYIPASLALSTATVSLAKGASGSK